MEPGTPVDRNVHAPLPIETLTFVVHFTDLTALSSLVVESNADRDEGAASAPCTVSAVESTVTNATSEAAIRFRVFFTSPPQVRTS